MQDPHTVLVISLTLLLHTSHCQWADDVLRSKSTCEEKFGFDSCIRSGKCMSDYFLECRCIPRDVRKVLGGGVIDGAILCMYSSHVMGTGEPRCCEYYYKRSPSIDKGTHFLNALVDIDGKPTLFKPKEKKDDGFITDLAVAGSFDRLSPLSNDFLHDQFTSDTRTSPDMTISLNEPKEDMGPNGENRAQEIGSPIYDDLFDDSDIKNMILEYILGQRKLKKSRESLKSEIMSRKYSSVAGSNNRQRLLNLIF